MWRLGLLATAGALLVVGAAWLAEAQDLHCAPRDEIKERLLSLYGETSAGRGRTDSGRLVEVLVAPETRSWTLLISLGPQRACLAMSGHDWHWAIGHGEREAWNR